jgi:hypothetical protein
MSKGKGKGGGDEGNASESGKESQESTEANQNEGEEWECTKCGSSNFGHRGTCHTPECRTKRKDVIDKSWCDPEIAAKWGQQAPPERIESNQKLREMYKEDPSSLSEDDQARAKVLLERDERKKQKKAAQKLAKERKKGQKRKAEDAVTVTKTADKKAKPESDEGEEWLCECGNSNFPFRDKCNRRACGKPRPVSEKTAKKVEKKATTAPAPAPATKSASKAGKVTSGGTWLCECGNKNFPFRDKCNRGACGKPRPPPPVTPAANVKAADDDDDDESDDDKSDEDDDDEDDDDEDDDEDDDDDESDDDDTADTISSSSKASAPVPLPKRLATLEVHVLGGVQSGYV